MKALLQALPAVLAAISPTGHAQQPFNFPEGPVAVAQCYSTCMDRSQRTALALYDRVDRLSDLLISDEYFALTNASRDDVVALEETAICALAQDHARGMDACHAGCLDLEQVYNFRASRARARFQAVLNAELAPLRDAGLWGGFGNSPTAGTRFDAACERYWNTNTGPAEAASRLASLPALLERPHGKAKRAKPHSGRKTDGTE